MEKGMSEISSGTSFCLQSKAISIACIIPCHRLVVPIIILGVTLERSFEKNSCSEGLDKTVKLINEEFTF